MSSWTAAGGGSDPAFSTISSSQAALLSLSCGGLSQSPVAPGLSSAPHTARLATEARGGSLPSAASSWASLQPSSATLPPATSASLEYESPKLPPMTTTPVDSSNPSLPSTIFLPQHVLEEWEAGITTTLNQGNATSAPQDSAAVEGQFTVITTSSERLLPGRSAQPQTSCPGGATVLVQVPQRQAERSQEAELGVDSDMSRDSYADVCSPDAGSSRAPRRRTKTRASPYEPPDPTDKDAIRKYKNRQAAKKCREGKEARIKKLREESAQISKVLKGKLAHRDELQQEVTKLLQAIQIHQRAGCTFVNLPKDCLQ